MLAFRNDERGSLAIMTRRGRSLSTSPMLGADVRNATDAQSKVGHTQLVGGTVMRWLTTEWVGASGEMLTAEEVDERAAAYQRHLDSLMPQLPDELRALAAAGLHDGRLERWEAAMPARLVLLVVCGDRQRGYERLAIEYRDAELVAATDHDLSKWFADPDTELLYQELDVLPDGRFEHRHLLWPAGEFAVRFDDARVSSSAATAKDYDQAREPASREIGRDA
jgi:hypothetical protein